MNLKPFMIDQIPTVKIEKSSEVEGLTLIDVRRPDEFTGELGHIKGAILKTLGPELESYLNTADKNQNILFICRSGGRSAAATASAQSLGFKNIYNMQGGMLYWNQMGFEKE